MTRKEICYKAESSSQLDQIFAEIIKFIGMNIPYDGCERHPGVFPKDTNGLDLNIPQAYALFSALSELLSNVDRGLVPKGSPQESINGIVDQALAEAKARGQDYCVVGRIAYDEETNRGSVLTAHPVVPNFSPLEFDINRAKIERREQRRGMGGLENIDNGEISERFEKAGLTKERVRKKDIDFEGCNKKTRCVGFLFRKKA